MPRGLIIPRVVHLIHMQTAHARSVDVARDPVTLVRAEVQVSRLAGGGRRAVRNPDQRRLVRQILGPVAQSVGNARGTTGVGRGGLTGAVSHLRLAGTVHAERAARVEAALIIAADHVLTIGTETVGRAKPTRFFDETLIDRADGND